MPTLIAFVLIICFLYYLSKKQIIQLSFGQITGVFILKIVAGCAYGYMYLHSNSGKDTWDYHAASLVEYGRLNNGTGNFSPIFPHDIASLQLKTFFLSNNSYWKDLPYNILIAILTFFNITSKGNYYINVVFYNLMTLWGHYLLLASVIKFFPDKKALLFLIIFLFPPLVFWESGIHKDGLVFTFLSSSIYFTTSFIFEKKGKWFALALFFLLLLVIFRSFVGLPLLPLLIAYYLSTNFPKRSLLIYSFTVIICIIIFFATLFGPNFINLPKQIAERQAKFMLLSGGSFMVTPVLDGSIKSYITVLPTALNHVFLRPYITEAKGILQLFGALETYFVIILLLICVIKMRGELKLVKQPMLLLLIFFAVINYILIGYTVPFSGAIVRYRVIFEVFLLIPILLIIDTNNLISNRLNRYFKD